MEILYVLSFSLSQMLKMNDAQALGLFSLAIKDASKKMGALSYNDCREVIQGPLKSRLEKLNTPNVDKVIAELLKVLAQKQSLFVVAAR